MHPCLLHQLRHLDDILMVYGSCHYQLHVQMVISLLPPAGWMGVGCSTCQADSACQSILNDTAATCDTALTSSSGRFPYVRSSTCNLTNPDFAASFKGAGVLCSLTGEDLPDWLLPPGFNISNFPPSKGTTAPVRACLAGQFGCMILQHDAQHAHSV